MQTIFVVEDDDSTLQLFRILFEKAGYAVHTFARPNEALIAFAGGDRPDLLLTDHDMPGMTDFDLAEAVRSLNWTGPILVLSGRAEMLEKTKPGCVARLYSKPILPSALRTIVAELLAPAA